MKTCTKCLQEKPESEYYKKKRAPDGLQFWCKVCAKGYYEKPGVVAKYVQRNARNRIALKKKIYEYKLTQQCSRCGENHPATLDFHHHKGDKLYNISDLCTYSWEKVFEEIKKCIVLCSNCHRIEHWEERKSNRSVSK